MGFNVGWDILRIKQDIYRIGRTITDPKNDGFTAWEIKKQLYEIKFLIDQIIEDSPTFTPESDYLESHDQENIVRLLKK